ncbi:hypothetical protein JTB14_037237 [Gonioctena quinquepunctata]|nr:hypothetical protein JTB14_037237 [Gonioctena quinquepunctata]
MLMVCMFVYGGMSCLHIFKYSTSVSLGALMNTLAYFVGALSAFFMIFCVPGQNLTDEALNVANTVYSTEWYSQSEHSTAILMIIANAQKEVVFSIGGLINMNLASCVMIYKACFSYGTFLRTVGLKE